MLDAFAEAGGTPLTPAHVYARPMPDGGRSERTLGKWLQPEALRLHIVSTKGGHPDLATMDSLAPHAGVHRQRREESLERLAVDSIDLYWLHPR